MEEENNKVEKEINCVKTESLLAEMCFDVTQNPQTYFCVYEDGETGYSDAIEADGIIYKPYSSSMDSIKNELVRFPTGIEEYGTEKDLIGIIEQYVNKLLDVTHTFAKLIPYYVLFTWVYDLFYELPYLRAKGDFGQGKSRFLKTIGGLCYTPMRVGHCTASYAFRIIERFKGTLILDEGDFKESSETEKFVKILNCGYEKDSPYGLTEQRGRQLTEVSYQLFGPKIIATRKEWQDTALESRCLTEDMMQTVREDIPENWEEKFDQEALHIRNKLLLWRFRHYKKTDLSNIKVDKSIEPRLRQIVIPLLSIIESPEIREELKGYIKERNRDIVSSRGMRFEAIIIETINKLWAEGSKNKIYMGEIAESININYQEDLDEKMTSQRVGRLTKNTLGLRTNKDVGGSYVSFQTEVEQQKLKTLKQRYGIESVEEGMTI